MPLQPGWLGASGPSRISGTTRTPRTTEAGRGSEHPGPVPYKLGKSPAVFDSRTLRFGDYVTPQLPAPPMAVDYGTRVGRWPLYDNDRYPNCTCAAAAHMIQGWSVSAPAETAVPLSAVQAFYRDCGQADPSRNGSCGMLAVLKQWQSRGLGSHKILGFAQLEPFNQTQVKDAIYLFGSAYIGLALPDFAVERDPLSVAWVVPPQGPVDRAAPNSRNGQCVPAVAYDARNIYIVTWGQLRAMSWPFYDAYMDEAYAALSPEWIDANSATVAGFDLAGMRRDVHRVQSIPRTSATVTRRQAVGV